MLVEVPVLETYLLTARERQVAALMQQGFSNARIAKALVIELGTVKNHTHNILTKLGLSSRHELGMRHFEQVPATQARFQLTGKPEGFATSTLAIICLWANTSSWKSMSELTGLTETELPRLVAHSVSCLSRVLMRPLVIDPRLTGVNQLMSHGVLRVAPPQTHK